MGIKKDFSLEAFIIRNKAQQLTGQTSGKHYRATKNNKTECSHCDKTECKLQRHRIDPYKEFKDENVLILCTKCHGRIQRMINELKAVGVSIADINYSLIVALAKVEAIANKKEING